MIKINGPKFRGDRYPEWRKDMVNEEEFADCMRCKSWNGELDGDTYKLEWVTQEDFGEYEFYTFMMELERYFNDNKFDGIKKVEVKCYCRDTYPQIKEVGQINI